ncbi:hypothetical protein HDV00_001288 [Rhizophlyctis rosea]|nr:hypothetical protein HDV00_001288 [Rhizophlyctis rosea]
MSSSDAVNALAWTGRVTTHFRSAGTVCIGLILFGVAAWLIHSSMTDKKITPANATLTNVHCTSTTNTTRTKNGGTQASVTTRCTADATYIVNGVQFNAAGLEFPAAYTEGSTAPVYYDASAPQNVSANAPIPKAWGWSLLVVAILTMVGAVGCAFLVKKNKNAAAATGACSMLENLGFGRNEDHHSLLGFLGL